MTELRLDVKISGDSSSLNIAAEKSGRAIRSIADNAKQTGDMADRMASKMTALIGHYGTCIFDFTNFSSSTEFPVPTSYGSDDQYQISYKGTPHTHGSGGVFSKF